MTRRPILRVAHPLLLVTAAVLLAACSDAEQRAADLTPPDASPEQKAELADGTVTAEEYETAFQRFRDCAREHDVELMGVRLDGEVYMYSLSAQEVADGDADRCYETEFRGVDMVWQGDLSS